MRALLLLLLAGCPIDEPPSSELSVDPLPACENPGSPGWDVAQLDFDSQPPPFEEVGGVVMADLDGGGADIVLVQRSNVATVFWDDGSSSELPTDPEDEFFGASTADYDADGRLDFVVAEEPCGDPTVGITEWRVYLSACDL